MTFATRTMLSAAVAAFLLAAPASAHGISKRATQGETVTLTADLPIANVPGKRLVSLIVDYAPGGSTASHRHPDSAFIYAQVISGEILSQVDDGPARVYRAGEGWFENPGAHHRVSENASSTMPARLIATFIVDEGVDVLVTPDSE